MGGAMFTSHMTGNDPSINSAMNNQYWAVQNLLNVEEPSVQQMQVSLGKLVQQGVLDPEMAQTFLQDASQYAEIDPQYMQSQLGALKELENIVDTDGLDAQSQNALYQLRQQNMAQERGQREAILENARARGISGSGIELASQMANQQGQATSLANQGFQAAADANQRKLQAIAGVGQLGGQLWGQEAQAAAAQDAINRFNTANKQAIENLNVGTRNQAQAQNLAEKQRIADQNVSIGNIQEMHNKGLYQQAYQNALTRAQSLANANLGVAQSKMGIAEHERAPMMTELQGQSSKWSDENLKTDVSPVDSKEFLDGITGYKYRYKDPDAHGQGPQVGVMAQDVEKVAPEAVDNYEDGKAINFSKLGGPILASLAGLNERVKELEDN